MAGWTCDARCEKAWQPYVYPVLAVLIIAGIVVIFTLVKAYKKQKRVNPNGWISRKGMKALLSLLIALILIFMAAISYQVVDGGLKQKRQERYDSCVTAVYGVVDDNQNSAEHREFYSSANKCDYLLRKQWKI